MATDKLHAAGARQCVELFSQLDAFHAEFEIIDGKKYVVIDDMNNFRFRVREIWQNEPEAIDDFITETESPLSAEDKQLVLSWKKGIRGTFIVVKLYPEYGVFCLPETGDMYAVKGLNDGIGDLLRRVRLPCFITTALFPYKQAIIWDGIIGVGEAAIGKDLAEELIAECEKARANGTLIMTM